MINKESFCSEIWLGLTAYRQLVNGMRLIFMTIIKVVMIDVVCLYAEVSDMIVADMSVLV